MLPDYIIRPCRIKVRGLRAFSKVCSLKPEEAYDFIQEIVSIHFFSMGVEIDSLAVEFAWGYGPLFEASPGRLVPAAGQAFYWRQRVKIYLGPKSDPVRIEFLAWVIGHEADHVVWWKEGKEFDCSLPYYQRPHEIRANEAGAWTHRWLLREKQPLAWSR